MNNNVLPFCFSYLFVYWRNKDLGIIQDYVRMGAFKSFQGHLSRIHRNRILYVVKIAVPGQDVTEAQAAMWACSFTFYTTGFLHFGKKPHHEVSARLWILFDDWKSNSNAQNNDKADTSSCVAHGMCYFKWDLEHIGGFCLILGDWQHLTDKDSLVMLSSGDDKPVNLYLFAYLFFKEWFQNSLGSLWK